MSQEDPIVLSDTEDEYDNTSIHEGDEQSGIIDSKEDSAMDEVGRELMGMGITEPGTISKPGYRDAYKGKRFRNWFFTWNNPKEEDKESLLKCRDFKYILFQLEKGKTGTLHYQGVFFLKEAKTCSAINKIFGRMGYLAPLKSQEKGLAYVSKEETRMDGPWSAGTLPKGQGTRSDLLAVKEIIDTGASMRDVFEQSFANAVRYTRGLSQYHAMVNKNKERKWQTIAYIYIGDAGMGKTEAAKAEAAAWGGGTYWLTLEGGMGGKVWWDGYEGEENIIIDEFHCQIRLDDFKRLIDSSPLRVPYKGGYHNFLGKRIWILSNMILDTWYFKSATPGPNRNALMRRLHYKEEFWTKFLGQDTHEHFVFMREQFVEAQKKNEFLIKIS